jgi:protein-disulfide isomerase
MKSAVCVLAVSLALPALAADKKPKASPPPPAPAPASEPALAIVAGEPIPASAVDERARDQLFQVRTQEYEVRLRALNAMIGERLLEREAGARGVELGELVKQELEAKAAPVTPEQIQAVYDQQKARFKDRPEEELKRQIEDELGQQSRQERRVAFVKELRAKAGVRILLEPPRIAVDASSAPVRGGKDAPVSIVEFSDFQCPYCIRVAPTLERLRATYGDKIKIAFRDFPLPSHALAPKAAEAAACAGEQGKFWEMHDRLFAANGKLDVPELKTYAGDLGLAAEAFAACLDGGKQAADWKADVAAGQRYGVTGTPAFFINGRMFVGAQPYDNFAAVIDDELARAEAKAPPPAKP